MTRIDLINKINAMVLGADTFVDMVLLDFEADPHLAAIARNQLQQGLATLLRAIPKLGDAL